MNSRGVAVSQVESGRSSSPSPATPMISKDETETDDEDRAATSADDRAEAAGEEAAGRQGQQDRPVWKAV
jgi:hypothetical protein